MTGCSLGLALVFILFLSPAYADINTADSARARGDYAAALAEYSRLAGSGDVVAQATLGYMLYVGEGTEQDLDQAISWYRQAAMQGNADAQYNLAVAYAFGEGVGQDFSEAVNWYTLAAEQEHAVAQYSLGLSYSYGEGVEQDPENAAYWFARSAENGYVRAQALLGSKYHIGDGVPLNYQEAARWYLAAAEQGDAIAQFNLGSMYRSGTGVSQDPNEALKWYELSSQQGYAAATDELLNLERALASQSSLRQATALSVARAGSGDPDNLEVLPVPQVTDADDSSSIGLRMDDGPLTRQTTGGTQAVEDDPELVASGLEYPELITMDNLDPSLPEEGIDATVQRLSAETENEPVMQPADAGTAGDSELTEQPARKRGFFGRLFSGDDNQPANEAGPAAAIQDDPNDMNTAAMTEEAADADDTQGPLITGESEEMIAAADEQQQESRGFFGRLFSRSANSDSTELADQDVSPETETLALSEPGSIIQAPLQEVDEVNFDRLDSLYQQGLSQLSQQNYSEALYLFRSAAAQGDPMAQYQLGSLYYQGLGLKQNYAEAALWYRRAAEQENVDAQYSLGNMYLMGEGIAQDDVLAKYWYNKAATQGHTSAKHNLDNLERFLQSNELVSVDVSDDISEIDDTLSMDIEQAVENAGPASAEKMMATIEPVLTSSAPSSPASVDYERGLAYSFGKGVARDLGTAFEYFKTAAEKNYAPAQYKLGVAYAYAEGTEQDKSQAVYWYQKAALQGHAIAQRNLGVMYENGDGVDQNKEMALAWYSILAERGNVMDIRRKESLSSELSNVENEAAEKIKDELLVKIRSNRY